MKSLLIPAILLTLMSLSVSGCHQMNAEESGEESHGEHEVIIATRPKAMDVVITKRYVCQIHSRRHIEVRAIEPGYLQ
ncbi:MAG TPA: efflux RND transporter periplasmic adaptor subunit, partial [Planctomycetaceae bacterium]|nr:efflux RND transporter periplasmic adaptor subunit [Planctomycetaceae bacterium]